MARRPLRPTSARSEPCMTQCWLSKPVPPRSNSPCTTAPICACWRGGGSTASAAARRSSAAARASSICAAHDEARPLVAAGHRVVLGGVHYAAPVRSDAAVQARLAELIPLAPLHQPHNLAAVTAFTRLQPDLLQVACFDT